MSVAMASVRQGGTMVGPETGHVMSRRPTPGPSSDTGAVSSLLRMVSASNTHQETNTRTPVRELAWVPRIKHRYVDATQAPSLIGHSSPDLNSHWLIVTT